MIKEKQINNINTEDIYNSKDHKRSRKAYCMECAFEYFVALMVSDTFLAMLLRTIGVSEGMIVIMSSLISLAFLFQFFAVFVVQKICNTKRFVIIFHFASQMVFMSLYLIPLFAKGLPPSVRSIIAIVGILAAYFGNYFVTSMIYRWGNSYVHPTRRARYSATKEMISLMSGAVVTIVVGLVMNVFTFTTVVNGAEKEMLKPGGLIFAAVAIFIFAVCDLVCLLLIKNDIKPKAEKKERVTVRDSFRHTIGNKKFRNVIYLSIIFNVAIYTTVGSMGAYKLDLFGGVGIIHTTFGAILFAQIVNNLGVLSRFALSKPFGRYSDKRSYTKGIELALILAVIAFGINIFSAPKTWFLVIIFTVLYHVFQAGTSGNMLNITYNYVDEKYFVQASAIKNSIGGVCGFLAGLLASLLVDSMEGGKQILGITIYAPQILSFISCLLMIGAFLFTKLVIEKQETKIK